MKLLADQIDEVLHLVYRHLAFLGDFWDALHEEVGYRQDAS